MNEHASGYFTYRYSAPSYDDARVTEYHDCILLKDIVARTNRLHSHRETQCRKGAGFAVICENDDALLQGWNDKNELVLDIYYVRN